MIEKSSDIYKIIDKDVQVVGIDEVQFFDEEIVDVAIDLANKGVRVIAAGKVNLKNLHQILNLA